MYSNVKFDIRVKGICILMSNLSSSYSLKSSSGSKKFVDLVKKTSFS
jgi:hypothetical protein